MPNDYKDVSDGVGDNLTATTPALADDDIATATPIQGYPDYEITDKGSLVYQRDVIVGKCGS